MDLNIDRNQAVPIYRQIADQIRSRIFSGSFPAGFRLPPERRLAQALGVNRSTVLAAYRELKSGGLLGAHVGRGTNVVEQPVRKIGSNQLAGWKQLLREGAARVQDPSVRDLLALSERRDVISMGVGLPAPDLLPMDLIRGLLDQLSREIGPHFLMHCPTEGVTPLRAAISEWMTTRGVVCGPADVMVLSGSQQGLDLAARVFLNPGDEVVVEEPSFFGALHVFRAAQARLIGVPTDRDGMRTDLLEDLLEHHRPKLIYTLPTFQNPSGATLSLERRQHLLELAYRHGIPILEDDPYAELRYEGEALPSLKSLDRGGHVLYLSTFSKMLFPGLRVGWLVAPRPLVRQFTLAKQTVDLHSSSVGQWLMERFLRQGHLARHLAMVRRAYAERLAVLQHALRGGDRLGLLWHRPLGGFYLWCQLPERVEQRLLLARAGEKGIAFLPGEVCFASEPPAAFLRLSFAALPVDEIREGAARLLAAVKQSCPVEHRVRLEEEGTPPIV